MIELMTERLNKAFAPEHLEVIDDSAAHVGHAGSAGGAGHYTIIISSELLKDKTRVEQHRAVYAMLNDLIPEKIHALRIKIK